MKKLYKFLPAVVVCLLMLVGCSYFPYDHGNIEDNNTQNTGNVLLLNKNTSSDGYFSDEMQFELVSALNSYVETDLVSQELLKMYGDADAVQPIPVFGTYLEDTSLVAYLFYKNDTLCSSATLKVDSSGDPLDLTAVEFAASDSSEYEYLEAFSNQDCFDAIQHCLNTDPDFEILGVVYSNGGYPMVLPIGRCKGETTIKYFLNEPLPFNLVEPFDSIEEGQALFALYWAEKDNIRSHLPVYAWKNADFYEMGYWNMYQLEFIYSDSIEYREPLLPVTEAYDSLIAIPLLDESFEENKLISHLLYYKNQLIGEVVLKLSVDENGKSSVVAAYANTSQKAQNGSYIPMSISEYQKSIEKARVNYPSIEIEGVIFKDGQYVPFAHQDDDIIYLVNP